MTQTTLPMGAGPDPGGAPPNPSAGSRQRLAVLAALGALAVGLLGVYLLLFRGGDGSEEAVNGTVRRPASSPTPSTAAPARPVAPGAAVTPANLAGRDPFLPLYVAPAPQSTTGTCTTGTAASGAAAATGTGTTVSPTPTPGTGTPGTTGTGTAGTDTTGTGTAATGIGNPGTTTDCANGIAGTGSTGTTGTGAAGTGTGTTGTGTTAGSGSTAGSGTAGAGAAPPAAPVAGTPPYTG